MDVSGGKGAKRTGDGEKWAKWVIADDIPLGKNVSATISSMSNLVRRRGSTEQARYTKTTPTASNVLQAPST